MRQLLFTCLIALPTQTTAQPYSESMADCAAVFQNAAQWVTTDTSADELMAVAVRWADAAVRQAEQEGAGTSEDAIWEEIDAKTAEWEAKGRAVFFTQDFRDWSQYCRKFADHTGAEIYQ